MSDDVAPLQPVVPDTILTSANFDVIVSRLRSNDEDTIRLVVMEDVATPEQFLHLATALWRNTHLQCLCVRGSTVGDAELGPMIDALRQNRGIVKLDLSGTSATDGFGAQLLKVLNTENSILRELCLDRTRISDPLKQQLILSARLNEFPAALKPIAQRAAADDPKLYEFELQDDPTDVKVYSERSTQLVVDVLMHNTTVRFLKLNECCRGEHCMRVLTKLLEVNPCLVQLTLARSRLSDEGAMLLVEALKKNPKCSLTELDLSQNEIGDEGAMAIAAFLRNNHKLKTLRLEGNRVSDPVAQRVRAAACLNREPSALKENMDALLANDPSITELDLRGDPEKGYFTNLGATTLAELLLHNTHVRRVVMSGNHVGPEGAKALGQLFRHTSTLTSVDLSSNPLENEGLKHIVNGLALNDAISACYVNGCGDASASLVEEIGKICDLNSQPLPVKKLLLHHCEPVVNLRKQESQPLGKKPQLDRSSMNYVAQLLSQNPQVTELDLSDNEFGDAGAYAIAEILQQPKWSLNLRSISLSHTNITDKGVLAIIQALRANYSLQQMLTTANADVSVKVQHMLDDALHLNYFPPPIKDIIPSIRENVQGVETIDLSHKHYPKYEPFGDDTCRIVFDALRENTVVTTVRMSGQKISNRGLAYLCECLDANKTITAVDFSHNEISPDGATVLAQTLQKNQTLTSLDLGNNMLGEDGGTLIEEVLRDTNRTLKTISVKQNRMSDRLESHILAYAAYNVLSPQFRHTVINRIASQPNIQFHGDPSAGYVDDTACAILCTALKIEEGCSVSSIDFSNNWITSTGAAALADAVCIAHITSVTLDGNQIGPAGADAFAKVASDCQFLREVSLLRNDALPESDPSLCALKLALRLNAQTTYFRNVYSRLIEMQSHDEEKCHSIVEVPSASLDGDGVELLFYAIGSLHFAKLKLLNLSDNLLDDDAVASHLVPCLRQCPAIQSLYLGGNKLTSRGLTALQEFVWSCSTLCVLKFDCGEDSEEAATRESITSSIQKKLDANNAQRGEEQLVELITSTTQQNLKWKEVAVVESVASLSPEEEREREKALMKEALRDMPPRKAYVRGMYAKKKDDALHSA